jgi:RNA polymerase sigma-70 factor (ECF subfamily)
MSADARFEALYERELPTVYGYARARLAEADAEDVTAEVFRAALQRLRANPDVELTRSWFLTVARNLIIDRWRRNARWEERAAVIAADVATPPDAWPSPSADRVLDALDRVAADHRAVLLLRYVDGCSSREIGKLLGRSSRAVDSLIARARDALIHAFDEAVA